MGQLVNGVWKDQWYDTKSNGGEFVRDTSKFRSWVTADGSPDRPAMAASRLQAGDTTSMSAMPAPGPTAR